MKNKRIIIDNIEKVSIISEELEVNELGPTEVLVENYRTIISPGTELSRYYGLKKGAEYPFVPGYCAAGRIIAKGSKVPYEVGDTVLHTGPHNKYHLFDYQTSPFGIFFRTDARLGYEEVAFLEMAWISLNGILPVDLKFGDTVAVFGMGILGLVLAAVYRNSGAKVIVLDPDKKRCQRARDMGIEIIVDCELQSQLPQLMKLTANRGVDIAVDASGVSAGVIAAINSAAKYGQVVLLGSPRESYETDVTPVLNQIHMKMLNVIGALNRRYNYREVMGERITIERSLKKLEQLLIEKKIDLSKIITHTIRPEEVATAYEGLMHKKSEYFCVVIDWE